MFCCAAVYAMAKEKVAGLIRAAVLFQTSCAVTKATGVSRDDARGVAATRMGCAHEVKVGARAHARRLLRQCKLAQMSLQV